MPDMCQNHAGVLDEQDKLTDAAKKKFIDDVIAELMFGSPSPNLCGDALLPVPGAEMVDLYDEQMYADWHAVWPVKYEMLAQNLNLAGGTPLFPICDLSVIVKLLAPNFEFVGSLDIPTITPQLLIDLGLPAIDVNLNFPNLLPTIPALPKIPPFDLPVLDFDLDMIGLGFFLNGLLQLPQLVIDLTVPPNLNLALSIPDLPSFFANICKEVKKRVVPPNPNAKGVDLSYAAACAVLARKATECTGIAIAASLVGSSPNGVVGFMGANRGYREPPRSPTPVAATGLSPREKILAAARSGVGLHSSRNKAHNKIRRMYAEFLFPDTADQAGDWHMSAVEMPNFSSCGCFMRAVYRKAGGTGDTNTDEPYRQHVGQVISNLKTTAERRGGVKYSPTSVHTVDLMDLDLQPGDGVLISKANDPNANDPVAIDNIGTHVLIIGEEIGQLTPTQFVPPKNRVFRSYEGGAPNIVTDENGVESESSKKKGIDEHGVALVEGQRIKQGTYVFQQAPGSHQILVSPSMRQVFYVFDGAKMLG